MMQRVSRFLTILWVAGALAGCAAGGNVTADAGEPHAVLSKSSGAKARSIYSVNILQVGPDKTFAEERAIRIKPGDYVLRVSPDLEAMARNENTRLQGNRFPRHEELVRELRITASAGNRYYIGARFDGPTLYDWEPVVVRVESLAGIHAR